jgi:thymidylate kinase
LNPARPHTALEVVHTWLDFRWRYRTQIRPRLRSGTTVICDRYAYDMATWNVPSIADIRLLTLLTRFTQRPDFTILLEAPAEVVRTRRDELTLDEIVRQQARLRDLLARVPGAMSVDASPRAREVAEAIRERVRAKTAASA